MISYDLSKMVAINVLGFIVRRVIVTILGGKGYRIKQFVVITKI